MKLILKILLFVILVPVWIIFFLGYLVITLAKNYK